MISVDQILDQHLPKLSRHPWLSKPLGALLKGLVQEKHFQSFAQTYPHLSGFPFVQKVLEYFDFTYAVRDSERERIPARGRVVIIANHPIGSLDGLALLNFVGTVRRDVKVVANDWLWAIEPLRALLLPVTILGGTSIPVQLKAIGRHLDDEGAVIIFPAGEVSRLGPTGIRDGRWHSGFLRLAGQHQAPVVPVHLQGRNSWFFYGISLLYKPLATLLLVKEMFKQQHRHIALRIGHPIPYTSYRQLPLGLKAQVKLFRRHLYGLAAGKPPLLRTERAIAHPVSRSDLLGAIRQCESLGVTPDGKRILCFKGALDSPILTEIGRLREIAFRAVGEGTGQRSDLDQFDSDYEHLLLWDPEELEIVGAYRLGGVASLMAARGLAGLYTHSLFEFGEGLTPYLNEGLELGRSFVQPRYWGRRALDYLWLGIGAYLNRHPQYRYLFGPVSISKDMPEVGKALMVHFYRTHFGEPAPLAKARNPYRPPEAATDLTIFGRANYAHEFIDLKDQLAHLGCAVPTLFKQYAELAEPGGVRFLDFGIDPNFSGCLDGLVLVDIQRLKPQKRARYLSS
jgi:putative hemolysin